MLPTASPSRARPPGGPAALDWRSPQASAFGAGLVVALLLTRMLRSPCPALPPAGGLATASALPTRPSSSILASSQPTTAYLRLDEALSAGPGTLSTSAWHPTSAARFPSPTKNGLLALALEGEGATKEAPRPHGAPPAPLSPSLSVIVPLAEPAAGPDAAATLASALVAAGAASVEVVLVAASPAAAAAAAAAGPLPPSVRVLTRTISAASPAISDHAAAVAACLNDGVRAARGAWAVVLAPGDRASPGAWAALVGGAASHPDADVLFTGPTPSLPPPSDEGGGGEPEALAGPPWVQAIPPGAAFRVAQVWRAGGGFPAVPAPGGAGTTARASLEAALWTAAAAAQGKQALASANVGAAALVSPRAAVEEAGGGRGTLPPALTTSLAVSMSGAPLPPPAVLAAHAHVLAAAARPGPARDALRAAALAVARATSPRGCPATAPVDFALGLLHEGGGRPSDAAAAYARAATCADGAGVPALAWAARVRGDAARAAGLVACVGRAGPAAEPGSPPRPVAGNAKADAAECVAVLGVAT